MADNIIVKDSTGTDKTMRTTDTGTTHIPHQRLSDGTNIVAIKAASTAAVAADPALVVSVSPNTAISVNTHAVTGTAANGAAASGNPVLIAGSDGTNARTVKVATDGTLLVNGVQDARATGSITSAASVVGPVSVTNRNVTTIAVYGTHAGVTFVIEATDDGTNWYGLQCINNATGQAAATWTPGNNASASYDTAVGGYTQVRVRATAWTSGTMSVGISNQVFAYDPVIAALSQGLAANGAAVVGNPVLIAGWNGTNAYALRTDTSGQVILGAGSNTIGSIAAADNLFFNDTTTALGASATFTGTSHDHGSAAGSYHRFAKFNAVAFADQAGTVRIEMSNDNTTWRRATVDTAVTANGVVTLSVPVLTRYYRVIYVNGATIQGAFMVNSSYTSA